MHFGMSALVLSALPACNRDVSKLTKEHPNVILILADDMGLGDLSYFNNELNRTPNLDRLVKESVWFNQAYSASPVSAPSRAGMLTGLYPHRTGCVTLSMKRFPEYTRISKSLLTMADIFKDNGYATGLIGKWHCGEGEGYNPLQRGFKEFEGFYESEEVQYFKYTLEIKGKPKNFSDEYLTDNLSNYAIDFVRRHKDEPFFLHLAHKAPHRPLQAPRDLVNYYLEKGFNENTATIYAMIEIMDNGIGKLMHELDSLGLREKTIIIFSSDNGPDPLTGTRFNKNLRGSKYTVYEGGIHVPFIFNWNGKVKPDMNEEIVHHLDILPTLIDICHLNINSSLKFDGGSLTSILLGDKENLLPKQRFWQWNRGIPMYTHNAAMREGQWKLVRPFETRDIPESESNQFPALFDLKNDPFEENDVSKEYPIIYGTMRVYLEEWCRDVEFSRMENNE